MGSPSRGSTSTALTPALSGWPGHVGMSGMRPPACTLLTAITNTSLFVVPPIYLVLRRFCAVVYTRDLQMRRLIWRQRGQRCFGFGSLLGAKLEAWRNLLSRPTHYKKDEPPYCSYSFPRPCHTIYAGRTLLLARRSRSSLQTSTRPPLFEQNLYCVWPCSPSVFSSRLLRPSLLSRPFR